MGRIGLLVVPVALSLMAQPADAGIFTRKKDKDKPNPADVVAQLTATLRTDPDEKKRVTAAEDLRQYDARTYPDVLTALVEALQRDTSASVRTEAAQSIGKIRPISQQAGVVLEQAVDGDSSTRVRMAARTALWQYHLVGYRASKVPEPPAAHQTGEPPIAAPTTTAPVMKGGSQPAAQRQPAKTTAGTPTSRTTARGETIEPPIAPPMSPAATTTAKPVVPEPRPVAPAVAPPVPPPLPEVPLPLPPVPPIVTTPKAPAASVTPKVPDAQQDGPDLGSPK